MLTLIRGIPGSGKSTLAKSLAEKENGLHYEADMFFERNGQYHFAPEKLQDAHHWCRMQTMNGLSKNVPVIVSNTFLSSWEIEPYIGIAVEAEIPIRIIECTDDFGSIHNVPAGKIEQMKSRFIPNSTLRKIFIDFNVAFHRAEDFR